MRSLATLKPLIEQQISGSPENVSVIEFLDLLVEYGYGSRASDIHVEPTAKHIAVRLRIDGILHDAFTFSRELHGEIISRIKVLSGLKTDIHHTSQDGRFKARIGETEEVDIRVSIAPTYYGENAVLRVLAETNQIFSVDDLGFSPNQFAQLQRAIGRPYGMILANGPTGSGKTTTLYTILKKLNTRDRSIITIEDPIEYSIPGITQIPVNTQVGLTFATGLRAILRQDPNIIMVGEIRDTDTANIAVNAALTGHLVLSTLHTNDAATTFPRLIDMGVPPFLVASTVNIAIAQRLVRIVCEKCRKTRTLTAGELERLTTILREFYGDVVYTAGKGCDACDGTGYRSRVGIHEVLLVEDKIRTLIGSGANASQIKQRAIENGMVTMAEDGFEKAVRGTTTIEEVLRTVYA